MTFPINTVGYWLSDIQDPIISAKTLVYAANEETLDYPAKDLHTALSIGFTWLNTPEGPAYWIQWRRDNTNYSAL